MLWQGLTHLEAHVVRQAGEEVVLHMAADERVAEAPIKQCIAGQVEHTQTHLLNALGLPIGCEHGEADVLQERHTGSFHPPIREPTAHTDLPPSGPVPLQNPKLLCQPPPSSPGAASPFASPYAKHTNTPAPQAAKRHHLPFLLHHPGFPLSPCSAPITSAQWRLQPGLLNLS